MSDPKRRLLESGVRRWLGTILVTVFYSSAMFYAYRGFVSPRFAYAGLKFRSPQIIPYIVSVGLTALVAGSLPARIRHPSDFVQWLFFILAGAPAILLSQYMPLLPVTKASQFGWVVAACLIFVRIGAALRPSITETMPKVSAGTVWVLLSTICLLTYAVLFATVGFTLRWVNIGAVYSVRADYSNSISGVPLIGYLLPVVYNVINPVFMARGICTRRAKWVIAGASGQLLIYITTGDKSVLFSILAVAGTAWLFRGGRVVTGAKTMLAMFYVMVIAIGLDKIFHTFLWSTMIVRRFLVIPGALAVAYAAVFGQPGRTHGGFAGTPLFWLRPPIGSGPSFTVGQFLTGGSGNNANVSFLGHGYYQYGYVGMFVEAAVFVLLLWAIDNVCRRLPLRAAAIILFMPTFTACSGNIFTIITSGGVGAAIIICALLPRDGWTAEEARAAKPNKPRPRTEVYPASHASRQKYSDGAVPVPRKELDPVMQEKLGLR